MPSRYEAGMNSADKEMVSDSLTSGGGGSFREELSEAEIKELEKELKKVMKKWKF